MLGQMYYPTGKAMETAAAVLDIDESGVFACNIAYGCRNACDYCYIPYIEPGEMRPAKVAPCEQVSKQFMKGLRPEGVFLSFATDPFLEENRLRTECLLKFLERRKIPVATLSKIGISGKVGIRNGVTVVSNSYEFCKRYEPNAPDFTARINAIEEANMDGEKTWVSLEPFPPPAIWEQNLQSLLSDISFVDFIIFGKWNYNKLAGTPEAREFYAQAVPEFQDYCKSHGIRHYIKKETLKFIENGR